MGRLMLLRSNSESISSPYLLQHADNPVDWWTWSDEAFDEARRRDVPIFLSVGYSACHWCHVMAHESFEDERIAGVLNERFVAIKVDREELPDVDAVYMEATQALTGQGGWPMSVFLDHDRRPFYAGTYFPPAPRQGMPGFPELLVLISEAWSDKRSEVAASSGRIADALTRQSRASRFGSAAIDAELLDGAVTSLEGSFDATDGGFLGAPKFPPSMALEFLLRADARHRLGGFFDPRPLTMVEITCEAMARGGMYDQLAGGFARYSVDAQWVVPHFEKMLYDNALLIRVYLHWWRSTGSPLAERVVRETVSWLLAELRTPEGGFAAALDADSPREPGGQPHEGAYYAFTPAQLREALGEVDGDWAAGLLYVTEAGTFEHGESVLQLRRDPDDGERWQSVRSRLESYRAQRPRPARDDKVVAAWNGLAIAALAEAGAIFGESAWVEAAIAAADVVVAVHLGGADPGDGSLGDRLVRVSRAGVPGTHAPGNLDDYANVAEGFLALYAVTAEDEWLAFAGILLDVVLEHFRDPASGGFFDTADDVAPVSAALARPQDPTDNASPSGWTAAAGALLTYAALTGSVPHRDAADSALGVVAALGARAPRYAGWGLAVAEAWLDGPSEVAIVGEPSDELTRDLRRIALMATAPGAVLAVGDGSESPVPLLRDRVPRDGIASAYVCRNFTCSAPTSDRAELARSLGSRAV